MSAVPIPIQPRSVGALIYDADGLPTWRYRVEPFLVAIAASGMTVAEIELVAGWKSSYLGRLLGLRPWPTGRMKADGTRYRSRSSSLSYENAKRLARALHVDLVEWEI